jgi:hypothetical protein
LWQSAIDCFGNILKGFQREFSLSCDSKKGKV